LTIKGKAYIAGIYEHPTRHAPDKSTAQLHAEVAKGAIEDAGLTKADIDGYFCAGDAPGGVMNMVDYLGLKVRHFDSTDTGGCSYLVHLGHAAEAIAAGKCSIALVTLAGKPRTGSMPPRASGAEADFEAAYGATTHNVYGMCAMRHMHDYGTTSEQLAWIKVAASHHAQYNPHAMLKEVVTVEDVLNSPMISDPLHRMDCCVVTDGGGLCSNHPVNRGGLTKILEAVRQLRGEAHPKVQVPNCDLAVAHGTGGLLGVRHAASTCILERV
jgi:acetyl-CoA C-acetyltransferase